MIELFGALTVYIGYITILVFKLDLRKIGVIHKDFVFLLMLFSNIKYYNLVELTHST